MKYGPLKDTNIIVNKYFQLNEAKSTKIDEQRAFTILLRLNRSNGFDD